jgi:uncharacterized protein YdhG (YjbR/CyaY superfamily)
MQIHADSPEHYIDQVPDDRKEAIRKLRETILDNLPEGFSEMLAYGMMGYAVPHSVYPPGYHCDPKQPLPFMGFASQKNSINFYHMGLYADPKLMEWFVAEYPKHSQARLDMGKSCVRFKKPEHIPYALIGELVRKVSVSDWIKTYETQLKR